MGRFLTDKHFVQQGFYIAEPFYVQQQGMTLKFLYAWDTGFDAYTTLFANRAFARNRPEELKAFLSALRKSYRYYIEVDPTPADERMLAINLKATPEFLAFSRQTIIDTDLHKADDFLDISREQYQIQLDQLKTLNIVSHDTLTVDLVMSDAFLAD